MKLLDSNILIYAAREEYAYLRSLVSHSANAFSILEVLGYRALNQKDRIYFEAAFKSLNILAIDQNVINQAITLRQTKNIASADAVIAATALIHDCEFLTRNEADFNWISDLKLINPIQ